MNSAEQGVSFQLANADFHHLLRAQSLTIKQSCAVKFAPLALKW